MSYQEFLKQVIALHTIIKGFDSDHSVRSHILFNGKLFSISKRKYVGAEGLALAKELAIDDAFQKYDREINKKICG
jgi:hypothetical protein